MKEVLIAALIPTIPAIITILVGLCNIRQAKMFAAKQSILQMQIEDVIAVELMHRLPCNHNRIHYEYDLYKNNGGNSDIDEKMQEYEDWYDKLEVSK